MWLIHPNSLVVAKGRRKWRWGVGNGSENYFGSTNTGVLDERKFKSSGSKVLGHRGKKWAEEERYRKKHLQAALVMGEKRSRRHTPRCSIAKQTETKTSIICVGFFSRFRSLDQKESSNAICSLCRALSAKGRRVHTLEHLFQEATWKIIL